MIGSKNKFTGSVAKERLELMQETESLGDNSGIYNQINQEIKEVINKYFDISSDTYEIKVLLKQTKKRAKNV